MNQAAIHAQLQRMRKTWMPPFNAHLTYSFFTLAPLSVTMFTPLLATDHSIEHEVGGVAARHWTGSQALVGSHEVIVEPVCHDPHEEAVARRRPHVRGDGMHGGMEE